MKSRALWAEFIGTFALVFVGLMAVATNLMGKGDIGRLGIALAHGFVIAVMASATMAISGGHINPAVSFGMWVGRRITLKRMIGYWVMQFAGAVSAAFVVDAIIPKEPITNAWDPATITAMPNAFLFTDVRFGLPSVHTALLPSPDMPGMLGQLPVMAMLIELFLTFFLVYVIFGTAVDWRAHRVGGLFIGLTVTLDILAGGPLTGAAMNPARWLGPAFVASGNLGGQGAYSQWFVYLVGPLLGAALAGALYGRIPEKQRPVADAAYEASGVQ